ncbi:UNVERIFIED_CONTAM: hypothetical protein NCL1_26484 [Trichonephila clavipes]
MTTQGGEYQLCPINTRISSMRGRSRNTWMAYDAEGCGFQMLNDDEIVTSVQKESDPVDDETNEDVDNNNNKSSKGPSMLTHSYGVVRTTIRVLFYSTTAAQENQRPCSGKTKMYNGTAKNR